jgi:hypothetical protein
MMKLPMPIAMSLSPLVEAARGEPLFEPSLDVESHDEDQMVIVSERGRFVFDRRQRIVLLDDEQVSDFDSVQSVDISAFPGGRGERSWALRLYRGFFDRITLGRTYDDGVASVAAAQLSRVLDVKVVALTRSR